MKLTWTALVAIMAIVGTFSNEAEARHRRCGHRGQRAHHCCHHAHHTQHCCHTHSTCCSVSSGCCVDGCATGAIVVPADGGPAVSPGVEDVPPTPAGGDAPTDAAPADANAEAPAA